MREMKDSKIEGVGICPMSWKVSRLSYESNIRARLGWKGLKADEYVDEGYAFISAFNIQNGRMCWGPLNYITQERYDESPEIKLQIGDVLLVKDGAGVGKCARVDALPCGEAAPNSSIAVITPKTSLNYRYVCYYLQSAAFLNFVLKLYNGMGVPHLTQEVMGKIDMLLPSMQEQRIICDFLDAKCAEINALTADIQSQIDMLEQYKRSVITEAVTKGLDTDVEMQDSCQEWVGMIPLSWKMRRGKYLFVQRNMRGNLIDLQLLSPTQKFGVVPQSLYEELSGMNAVKLNEKADLSLLKTIHKGDFCISLRSFQGGFEYSEYEGVVSPAYQVFYPITIIADGYYRYLFKESGFIEKMNSYTMTLRDGKNIAFADFGNTYIPYPPLKEQENIADFLDAKCAEIDSVVADKKTQLETLNEYKKSLIFEYVTGKKEVPAAASLAAISFIDPHIILAGIVLKNLGEAHLGKIQLAKVLYFFDYHLGLGLNTQYYRFPHGPYDIQLDSYLNTLQNRGWFKKISDSPEKYVEGENYSDFCKEKERNFVFLRAKNDLDTVISFAKTMKRTSQVERAATLFAAWNDFLLDGITPSDDQIIREVMGNWTENKANTKYDTWKDSLDKLKKSGILPKGLGLRTLPKTQKGDSND